MSEPAEVNGGDVEEDLWEVQVNEKRPAASAIFTWGMIGLWIAILTYWMSAYTGQCKALKWGTAPTWVIFLAMQIIMCVYSVIATNFIFTKFPTILRIPFLFIGFVPAFAILAWPFLTDCGQEFAMTAP
jgi:hypothetical protein